MKGMIFDIQEMTFHDGPGGRITFFLKGCPLRCMWCHNPEGLSFSKQLLFRKNRCIHCGCCQNENGRDPAVCLTGALTLCGQEMTSEELINRVIPLKETLKIMKGGITFSGGEPCAQPEFLLECLVKAKNENIHTAIETSGYCEPVLFKKIAEYCDFVYMDLKLMDLHDHEHYTGQSNQWVLENAQYLMSTSKQFCFRTPLIEGITDTEKNLEAIEAFIKDAPWEKLSFNPLASVKYEQVGMTYPLSK